MSDSKIVVRIDGSDGNDSVTVDRPTNPLSGDVILTICREHSSGSPVAGLTFDQARTLGEALIRISERGGNQA